MSISSKKLWKLLIDRDMGRTQMANEVEITGNVLGRLSRNEPVSMRSMEKICSLFDCDIGNVMEFVKEP